VAIAFPTAGWNDPDTFVLSVEICLWRGVNALGQVMQFMLGTWELKQAGGQYNLSRMTSCKQRDFMARHQDHITFPAWCLG